MLRRGLLALIPAWLIAQTKITVDQIRGNVNNRFREDAPPLTSTTNLSFTLSKPNPISIDVYRNGLFQRGGGGDYNLVGTNVVTFVGPLAVGDLISFTYFSN